jgi:hypothetical protein
MAGIISLSGTGRKTSAKSLLSAGVVITENLNDYCVPVTVTLWRLAFRKSEQPF